MSKFKYNNKWSDEMGLSVSIRTTQTSPSYDVEFERVPGRDGDLVMDNKRFNSFVYPIHTYARTTNNINVVANEISKWLKQDIRYKDLELAWDPNYLYKAIFFEQYDIEEMLHHFGRVALNFRCHPIKFLKSGRTKVNVTNGMTLLNPENRNAKPLIKITGSGNITLKNNGADWIVLRAVDGNITVDSALKTIYKNNTEQFNKMASILNPLFPELKPGNNVITWTGTVTALEITPNYEAVI